MYPLGNSVYPFIKMGLNCLGIDSGYVRKPVTTFIERETANTTKNDLKKSIVQNDVSGIQFLDTI